MTPNYACEPPAPYGRIQEQESFGPKPAEGHTSAAPSSRSGSRMSRTGWAWTRFVAAAVTFTVLFWRLGTGPFVDGIRTIDGPALAAAAGITVLTTLCCAWRWTIVARGLGTDLPLPAAMAAYYRSQFLNVTLPGGIAGDVHRGVSHGRDVGDVSRGLRAVAWERTAGQVVQAVLTVAVLLVLPSPMRSAMPLIAIALAVTVLAVPLAARAHRGGGRSRLARIWRVAAGDIRDALIDGRAMVGIALSSAAAVAGFAATFVIAAHTAGVTAPLSRLLPLALLAMLAMVMPNVAGWGPREGVTAWVFGAAGLGASQGVATAVVFGVLMSVSSLPGVVFLAVPWLRRDRHTEPPEPRISFRERVATARDGAARA
jgi:uncharacterized membrane protein YbhN (UPF0104 family)